MPYADEEEKKKRDRNRKLILSIIGVAIPYSVLMWFAYDQYSVKEDIKKFCAGVEVGVSVEEFKSRARAREIQIIHHREGESSSQGASSPETVVAFRKSTFDQAGCGAVIDNGRVVRKQYLEGSD